MTIPTENPWNSSHLEHPREPREIARAGQRRKCHIIDLSECSKIARCHVHRLGSTCTNHLGGLRSLDDRFMPACRRKAVGMATGAARAGQRGKCNRIDLSECHIVIQHGPLSLSRDRYPGLICEPGKVVPFAVGGGESRRLAPRVAVSGKLMQIKSLQRSPSASGIQKRSLAERVTYFTPEMRQPQRVPG